MVSSYQSGLPLDEIQDSYSATSVQEHLMFAASKGLSHQEKKERKRERPLLAKMRSSCSHLPHSLVFKTGLAYLECASPVETASWKFLSPQLLSRRLVL